MCAVTASIGVGMFHDDATNAEHLIRAADRAMYEAKRTGKRRIGAFGARQLRDLHAPPPESHLPAELERLDDTLSRPPSVAYSRLLTG